MTSTAVFIAISLCMEGTPERVKPPAPDRLHAGITLGMGAMLDRNVPGASDLTLVPAFFVSLTVGGPSLGAAVQFVGAGRNASEEAPNREIVDLSLVFRPAARLPGREQAYGHRIIRSLALFAGPAYERIGKVSAAVNRFGFRTGAHLDVPLEPPKHSEARLRLAAQRMWGPAARFGNMDITDSVAELVVSLAVLF